MPKGLKIMANYELKLKQVSSLEKVFFDKEPTLDAIREGSALKGEEYSYQIAFTKVFKADWWAGRSDLKVSVNSELAPYVTVRKVRNVPVELAAFPPKYDAGYYSLNAGMYPDPLMPIDEENPVYAVCHKWHALWVSVRVPEDCKPGVYPIEVVLEGTDPDDDYKTSSVFELEVIDVKLPKQEMIFTQWFHCDCIADLHGCEIFSDKHWEMIEKYIRVAVDNGINMLLTPLFTPPLDTAYLSERKTVQLVDCFCDNGKYSFKFDKLDKWIDICLKNGVQYFEMSHLFTQWGAVHTPKIVVMADGKEEKRFGWHMEAKTPEYKEFIDAMMPELVAFLKAKGVQDKVYFHVSDEPFLSLGHLETYKYAKELIAPYTEGFKMLDALSDIDFYKEGLINTPVPASDHIEKFLKEDIKNRWVYYCSAQAKDVSNRFLSQPSPRNRIMGTQMFKYDCVGFLHWGFNYFYSILSKGVINPFETVDSGGAFPAGDAFSVYPYGDEVVESIRLKVFKDGIQDYAAMHLLASYKGKEYVVNLIEEIAGQEIRFDSFPYFGDYILRYRERINQELKNLI
ncbi:MAG: DUF4091 domain-containing protein [Ruminococcaceae bacterium]|nr:DUF4091 domain-containing protein [Oscillospiraceae bacterium]